MDPCTPACTTRSSFASVDETSRLRRGRSGCRAERLANLRTGRTTVDTVAHAPQEEQILPYGDNVVLYTTLLTLGGQYGGRALQQGRYRALVVWVRRAGRWQQVASQLTAVAAK